MSGRRPPTEAFWHFCAALNRHGVDYVERRPTLGYPTTNPDRVVDSLELSLDLAQAILTLTVSACLTFRTGTAACFE